MKTKRFLFLLSMLLCLCLFFALASCGEEPPAEELPTGEQPDNGGGDETPDNGETPDEGGEEAPHEHSFGKWTVIKEATCGAQGKRMRICACGEREYETDFATENHLYGAEDKCVVCGNEWDYYEELSYELNADGLTYTVVGFGGTVEEALILPHYHEGLPVTGIAPGVFRGTDGLVEVQLTDYITHIGAGAFENCTALNLILFEKNTHLNMIGARAFAGTAITAFEIPSDVLVIGDGAFANCQALAELTVAEGNNRYAVTQNGCLVDKASGTLLRMSARGAFPNDYTVSAIAPGAFDGCGADEIVIPASVTFIAPKAFENFKGTKVKFAVTEGWYVTDTKDAEAGDAVTLTEDLSANCALLTKDYVDYFWYVPESVEE